jgi:hypothetical protein
MTLSRGTRCRPLRASASSGETVTWWGQRNSLSSGNKEVPGEHTTRLKIVVSPVRVRVSPSRNPCKQAIFVQRSEAREKAGKGRWPCCRSVVERPRPRRHSRERDEEYTMRFVYGGDPARRPRPICHPRPSRCRGRARRRSCGVRRTLQGRDLVRAIGDDVTSQIRQAVFRGWAFLKRRVGVRRPAEPCPPGRRRAPPVVRPVPPAALTADPHDRHLPQNKQTREHQVDGSSADARRPWHPASGFASIDRRDAIAGCLDSRRSRLLRSE